MFIGVLIDKITDNILTRPDIPLALITAFLTISFLFYLLMRSYKYNEKIVIQLESQNTLMATMLQLINEEHRATIDNREIIQRIEISSSNNSIQINNLFSELKSHRDECNRKK
jgi:hypothetical protein